MTTAPPKSNNDNETVLALYRGLNQDQLMGVFRVDNRTAKRKIAEALEGGVKPSGRVRGSDIYDLRDIAPYFVKPAVDVEAYIRQMDPRELPKMLTKEFWTAQRNKQEYELRAGNLWPTEKVVEEVGELMKLVKMSTLLMLDAVERQTELSDRQRDIIQRLAHGMLDDLVKRIDERFVVENPSEFNANVQLQEDSDNEDL